MVTMTHDTPRPIPQAYANVLKANMDGLKKRDKKTAKAAASSKRKATH